MSILRSWFVLCALLVAAAPLPATDPAGPAASPPAAAPPLAPAATTEVNVIAQATARLKELVARQAALLAALGKEDVDQDNIKRDLQNLIFDYDAFLRVYPAFAPGYVTYGLLLGKVGMRRESAAILLKANQLDSDLPLVKNQLGNYLAEEGEPLEAVNYFLAAIRLAPDEPLYHYQLGTLLTEARDDFLKSGHWSRPQLDQAMHTAFRRAAELAPDNFAYAYRYAESFYDLAEPDWDGALKVWGALEERAATKNSAVTTVLSPLHGAASHCTGMSQPPKNSVTIRALAVTMFAYSAMKNIENFIALYSE